LVGVYRQLSATWSGKQEQLAILLASGRGIKAAAEELGIGERTAHSWLASPGFRGYLQQLRASVVDAALGRLVDGSTKAADALVELLESSKETVLLRLALIFTLLDMGSVIEDTHVHAALALWRFCDRSAACLFGGSVGDRDADAILSALRLNAEGMTRTEIRRHVFRDNKASDDVALALGLLRRYGLIREELAQTGGRPAERWYATSSGLAPT
jgi:hypothetical protein